MQREQFENLVNSARYKLRELEQFRISQYCKYGNCGTHHWRNSELTKYRKIQNASDKACEKVFKALDEISPRSWRSIVPYHWAIENVTFDMAISRDEIPVPPISYGYQYSQSQQWASPVS